MFGFRVFRRCFHASRLSLDFCTTNIFRELLTCWIPELFRGDPFHPGYGRRAHSLKDQVATSNGSKHLAPAPVVRAERSVNGYGAPWLPQSPPSKIMQMNRQSGSFLFRQKIVTDNTSNAWRSWLPIDPLILLRASVDSLIMHSSSEQYADELRARGFSTATSSSPWY